MNETFQQKDQGFLTYPTSGWRKAMFKWPVQLWRLGLGPILGRFSVLISHTGRKTGLTRRTLTELHIVDGQKYAPSGFGRRSQWYRNIEVDPRVTIQTADGAESVIASRVTDNDELLALLDPDDPMNKVMLKTYMASLEIEQTPEDILAKKDRIYILRFDPTDEPTPPPLPADLVWLWPAALFALLTAWLLTRKTE
ncbi:MAG: nitroreductase/quinone reductase family protein [Chloroflexota bacterium]|jgi:deazaflavin-dependent oxidoreductase (nitroreductase family)